MQKKKKKLNSKTIQFGPICMIGVKLTNFEILKNKNKTGNTRFVGFFLFFYLQNIQVNKSELCKLLFYPIFIDSIFIC